jgi:hypothetical protein
VSGNPHIAAFILRIPGHLARDKVAAGETPRRRHHPSQPGLQAVIVVHTPQAIATDRLAVVPREASL